MQHELSLSVNTLLDRKADPKYLQTWADLIGKKPLQEPASSGSQLVFNLGGKWFGLAISFIKEIAPKTIIHKIPHRCHSACFGLINLKGNLIPCLSLEKLLQMPEEGEIDEPDIFRFVCFQKENDSWAFPVHRIAGIYPLNQDLLMQNEPVILLKGEKLFDLAKEAL